MTSNEPDSATRVCEWCAEAIHEKALKCPRCQKWRKDIDEDRMLTYVWSALGIIIPFPLLVLGMVTHSWHEAGNNFLGFLEYKFSLTLFFCSFSGIAIIVVFLFCEYRSWRYWEKVSKKIGTWIWW